MNDRATYSESQDLRPPQYPSDRQQQLPSFENLIRDVGQTDLAYRGQTRLGPSWQSPPTNYVFKQFSLPTPPATSQGKQASDLFYQYDQIPPRNGHQDYESEVTDDHRRASMAMLTTHHPPAPRPARAYSSNNAQIGASPDDLLGAQHVRNINERSAIIETFQLPQEITGVMKEHHVDRVNPKWGTTKAGKPRKRLGQACNTCREKKTKCDPGYPKCSQCQRFNRDCRFDQSSRHNHRSPELQGSTQSPPATSTATGTASPLGSLQQQTSFSMPMEDILSSDLGPRALPASPESVSTTNSPGMAQRQLDDARSPSKRPRLDIIENGAGMHRQSESATKHTKSSTEDVAELRELNDHAVDAPAMIHKYLTTWLDAINLPTMDVMPRTRFSGWLHSVSKKSLHERVAVYAMLASATTLSSRMSEKTRRADRSILKKLVYDHLDRLESSPCLQLVHILLYLAITELFGENRAKGLSLLGRCFNTAEQLQMYAERTVQAPHIEAYGFPPEVFEECRRRTFWAIYCVDCQVRMLGVTGPVLGGFNSIFLRSPCSADLYDQGTIPVLPFFDLKSLFSKQSVRPRSEKLSSMLYLAQILSICLDIVQNNQKHELSLKLMGCAPSTSARRQDLEQLLQGWADGYTEALRTRRRGNPLQWEVPGPRDTHLQGARACRFAGLDFFYHFALLEMNRQIFEPDMPRLERKTRAQLARLHAGLLLKLVQQLLERGGTDTTEYELITRTPAIGAVLLTSIDIITSAGSTQTVVDSTSGLMSSLYAGLELLERLGSLWASARDQKTLVETRLQAVFQAAQAAVTQDKPYFYCVSPIIPIESPEFDIVYGGDRMVDLKLIHNAPANITADKVFVI